MLLTQLADITIGNIGFEPTEGQVEAAKSLAGLAIHPTPGRCLLLKGYAGTGKTSLIAAYVKSLSEYKIPIVLLAPTGRAAKVLSSYCGYPAYTIHKYIYRQKSLKDGLGRFDLDFNSLSNAIFIIDEASMISNTSHEDNVFGSGELLNDLIDFVRQGKNCRLVLVGDTAQLPPIGLDISPALDRCILERFGLEVSEIHLREVVRQDKNSGILRNANLIREMLDVGTVRIPAFETDGFGDVCRLSGSEILETLTLDYERLGREGNVVLCYSNRRANRYNEGIRARVLYRDEELSVGDFLMVARNSYFWVADKPEIGFIANGDIVEVVRIGKYYQLYDRRFADVTLRLLDYQGQEVDAKIMLDTLTLEGPSLTTEQSKNLFARVSEDYAHVKTKPARMRQIREDHFFNAIQVKFAYAVTCHKAQGGQWRNVYLDQGFFRDDMLTREYLRWLYTAITRATEKLYFVNFDDKFFA